MSTMSSAQTNTMLPLSIYRLFFLYIEPISALVGAYYAAIKPEEYLSLLTPSGSPSAALAPETKITLLQLANLYLLFAFNEHFVLSSTSSMKTWRRLLLGLLIADLGHLYSMYPMGSGIYWRVWEWNAMAWGSVAFVYIGATMRLTFLAGTSGRG